MVGMTQLQLSLASIGKDAGGWQWGQGANIFSEKLNLIKT